MRGVLSRRDVRLLLGAAGVVALAAVAAYATEAATTSTPITIQACQNTTNGGLRVVASAADCRTGEAPLSWNVQGPQGEAGQPGQPGQTGSTGDTGPTGEAGSQGET